MVRRVFYASGGGGDLVAAHEAWMENRHDPSEVSVTFSSQIADYCRNVGAEGYFVAPGKARTVEHGKFTLEHRPRKGGSRMRFHWSEMVYALGLLRTARRFRADLALLDTGALETVWILLFRLMGIRVVLIMHNTLWPAQFPPRGLSGRVRRWLDRLALRHGLSGALCVSPQCETQLRMEVPEPKYPIAQVRAQFYPDYFVNIAPPPAHEVRPFRVMFIGRVTAAKGVLDILDMAKSIEATHPGLVHWTICGRGDALDELGRRRREMGLEEVVELPGWVTLEQLRAIYDRTHAAIVPTRSAFAEGLAMTAAEAVLAGRPVVTNPVVPAHEVLHGAVLLGRTNDPQSHAQAVLAMATDNALYTRLQGSTAGLGAEFYDRSLGLCAGIFAVVDRNGGKGDGPSTWGQDNAPTAPSYSAGSGTHGLARPD